MKTIEATSAARELTGFGTAGAVFVNALGIDPGNRPEERLAEGCSRLGLDLNMVLSELRYRRDEPDPASMDPVALMAHLERTHHAYARALLPRIVSMAGRAADRWALDLPQLLEVEDVLAEVRLDLEPHLLKEERVLFPMIRELAHAERLPDFPCDTLLRPIEAMVQEHDATAHHFARIRALAEDPGFAAAAAVGGDDVKRLFTAVHLLDADTQTHVFAEDQLLFPSALALEARLAG